MKITPADYDELAGLVKECIRVKSQSISDVEKWYETHGLSKERFLWDTFHGARAMAEQRAHEWQKRVYRYANDEHITTALRHIINALKRDESADEASQTPGPTDRT